MKRICSILLCLILMACTFALGGCALLDSLADRVPTVYNDAEDYTPGDKILPGVVDSLYVFWQSGTITVTTHADPSIEIYETANQETDTDFKLHWNYVDTSSDEYGHVLYVQYASSGRHDFGDLEKNLTIVLPENDNMHLSFTVNTVAVNLDVSGFENDLEKLSVVNYGGSTDAKIHSAELVQISGHTQEEAVSDERCSFRLSAVDAVETLLISTSHAAVKVTAQEIGSTDLLSSFADIDLKCKKADSLTLKNSTGKITAAVETVRKMDIESYQNVVELYLPETAAFTLTVEPYSSFGSKDDPGEVSVLFEGVVQEGNTYRVGEKGADINVSTGHNVSIIPQPATDAAQ